MKKVMILIGLIAGILLISLSGNGANAEDEETEDMGFTYGVVINITNTKLVIREYDFDTDEEKEVTYVINASTQFINIESIKDVEVGDEVDINYIEQGGVKMARVITKEMPGEEMPDLGEQNYESSDQESEEAIR